LRGGRATENDGDGPQERDLLMVMFACDPTFSIVPPGKAPITDDPRWAALVQRIGVAS
jgi:hypothetical protein